jgi:hypothetical protein
MHAPLACAHEAVAGIALRAPIPLPGPKASASQRLLQCKRLDVTAEMSVLSYKVLSYKVGYRKQDIGVEGSTWWPKHPNIHVLVAKRSYDERKGAVPSH